MAKNPKRSVMIIGDVHFPFVDMHALEQVIEAVKQHKPDIVVQIGDLYDMFAMSRFYRTHNISTPQEEIEAGREMAEEMWTRVKRARGGGKLTCFQLMGNHDVRPFKRMLEKFPEVESLLTPTLEGMFHFPGVQTLKSDREELEIDGVKYIHGYLSKLGDHARYMLQSTVTGHSHRGGTHYFMHKKEVIWELNAGHIARVEATPLQYSQTKTIRWTHGYGLIDQYGPRFVPILDVKSKLAKKVKKG